MPFKKKWLCSQPKPQNCKSSVHSAMLHLLLQSSASGLDAFACKGIIVEPE